MSTLSFQMLPAALDRGEIEACRAFLDSVHSAHSNDPSYLAHRADLLRRAGDMAGALDACLDLSRRFPVWQQHRYTMADVAGHLGEIQAVLPAFDALAAHFGAAEAHQIRAEAWYLMGLDRELLSLPAESGTTRLGRMQNAQALMRLDGIPAGLAIYRDAWTTPAACEEFHGLHAADKSTYWHGQCALPARLRLTRRGGIGDYFLWARYLPLLEARGTHIVHDMGWDSQMRPRLTGEVPDNEATNLDCVPAPLAEMWTDPFTLFANLFPRFGHASMPQYFLPPSSELANSIAGAARVKARGKPCRAIFWSANESHGHFALKSVCLPQLGELLAMDDVHWVVLQRGHQMRLWMQDERCNATTNVTQPLSIDDTAALLSQLDGAVVVDTAIAHISAALGVPTYMLASRAACWRYEHFEHRTPWYGNIILFRQPVIGDWRGAVRNAASAISANPVPSISPLKTA